MISKRNLKSCQCCNCCCIVVIVIVVVFESLLFLFKPRVDSPSTWHLSPGDTLHWCHPHRFSNKRKKKKAFQNWKKVCHGRIFSILGWFIHFLPRIATILPPVSGLSKCGSFVLTSTYTSTSTNPLIHFPIEFNSIHSSKTAQASPHIPLYSVQIQTFLTNLTFNSIQPLSVVALSCTAFQAKS